MNRRDIVKSAGAFGMVAAVPVAVEPTPVEGLSIVTLPSGGRTYMSHEAIEAVLQFLHNTMNDTSLTAMERMQAAQQLAGTALLIEENVLLREQLSYTVKG